MVEGNKENKKKICPSCGREVEKRENICPYCGELIRI